MNLIAIMNEWEFYTILRNRGTKREKNTITVIIVFFN